ncbi:Imm8 family immunity protein [Yoonia sp. BS5-3]|uniref:Imm8 family immunity protein n=1 Tax=Yoonia phaeophyticola TaxID=3137369 RepID=A0ABZ2V7B9_9RHOB
MKKRIIPNKPQFEIKGYDSSDVADLEIGVRDDPASFAASFQFCIGEVGKDAADVFEIVVCSHDKATSVQRQGGPLIAMPVIAPKAVYTFVDALVAHANKLDDPLAYLISKLAWEFDGYR